jgi:pimeloyl-ACP methyl ester carboxylesterase
MLRLGFYAQRHHKTKQLRPPLFTDDELRSLRVPAVFVVAEKSEVFPSKAVVARLSGLDARVEVVPDAGHAVVDSHAPQLMRDLEAFLERGYPGGTEGGGAPQ